MLEHAQRQVVTSHSNPRTQCYPQTLGSLARWLSTIAKRAPEAPILLIGTHKDLLEKADLPEIGRAQQLLTEMLNDKSLDSGIARRIWQTSDGKWFFAVDSTARVASSGGLKPADPVIDEVLVAVRQLVATDQRRVKGLCVRCTACTCQLSVSFKGFVSGICICVAQTRLAETCDI